MFTGIIETMGTVRARRDVTGGVTFQVAAEGFRAGLAPGDSVSINGACHTVERHEGDAFEVTSVAETLRRTTMGDLVPDARVNLELPATPSTALGGHIVQGHVDGVATVSAFDEAADDRILTLELSAEVWDLVVPKGSIAVDGVSLTVVERLPANRITIAVIPHTLERTNIGAYRAGDRVNVEADVIGKYVKQYIERLQEEPRES
jgi:riboflavin synthase